MVGERVEGRSRIVEEEDEVSAVMMGSDSVRVAWSAPCGRSNCCCC